MELICQSSLLEDNGGNLPVFFTHWLEMVQLTCSKTMFAPSFISLSDSLMKRIGSSAVGYIVSKC